MLLLSSGENSQAITTSLDNSGSNFPDGGVNKLLDDSTDSFSDLMLLILSIDTLACVCLNLFLILFMMILFKFLRTILNLIFLGLLGINLIIV